MCLIACSINHELIGEQTSRPTCSICSNSSIVISASEWCALQKHERCGAEGEGHSGGSSFTCRLGTAVSASERCALQRNAAG